jgi:hypothetical protein
MSQKGSSSSFRCHGWLIGGFSWRRYIVHNTELLKYSVHKVPRQAVRNMNMIHVRKKIIHLSNPRYYISLGTLWRNVVVSMSVLPDGRDAVWAGGGWGGPGTLLDFTSDMVTCPPNPWGQQEVGKPLNGDQMFTAVTFQCCRQDNGSDKRNLISLCTHALVASSIHYFKA